MITPNMSRSDVESQGLSGASKLDVAKVLNDFYLYTNSEELSVGRWLSTTGYWESWITSWMTKNIKTGDVCVDLGSNYGYYTRIMEKLSGPNGLVHSIEANTELCELIKKSLSDFPIENSSEVIVYDLAISDKTGTDTLDVSSKYIGGSSLVHGKVDLPSDIKDEYWDKSVVVKTDKLDNIISGHINLMKIDIEGAEPLAWAGMKNTLVNTDVVVLECGSYSPPEFIDEIFNSYRVSYIDFDGNEVSTTREEFDKFDDLIMAVLRK